MRSGWVAVAVAGAAWLIGAGGLSACSKRHTDDFGGHTNWLPCKSDADCSAHPRATCSEGYCIGATGERVMASASDAGQRDTGSSTGSAGRTDGNGGTSGTASTAGTTTAGTTASGAGRDAATGQNGGGSTIAVDAGSGQPADAATTATDAGGLHESLVGCRGPLDPGCAECAIKGDPNGFRTSDPGADWYNLGTNEASCGSDCPPCASCSHRDERHIAELGVRPECMPCPADNGIDPCFGQGSCQCWCAMRAGLLEACPTLLE